MLFVRDETTIPDLSSKKSACIAFAGKSSVKASRMQIAANPNNGMEVLKRFVSSASFSVIVLSGITDVIPEIKPSSISWLADHLSEPGMPAVVVTGAKKPEGVFGELREVETPFELTNILMNLN